MEGEYYGNQAMESAKSAGPMLKAFTVRDRIEQQLKELEHRKNELLKFRDLLDRNPDTEQILNLSRNIL